MSGCLTDVTRGDSPASVLPALGGPVEREQRRAETRGGSSGPGRVAARRRDRRELLHGTFTADGRVFLVAAISRHTGIVLGQRQVNNERAKGSTIAGLPAPLDRAGMVLTLDALHTTHTTARLTTAIPQVHSC